MNISVIIPTRPDDDRVVSRCVASLLPQVRADDQIIVSVDGAIAPGRFQLGLSCEVVDGPTGGPGLARNRGLERARCELILFLNDDVVAQPGLLDAHRDAHAELREPSLVLGSAPWHVPDDDLVIDRLLRETSLIFFYDRMHGEARDHDWGFRHAWTLNLSLPRSIVQTFDPTLAKPMFDDLEWAFRIQRDTGAPVLYRPEAGVVHHHRYTPEQILRREVVLGHQVETLRRANPACADAVFGDRFTPAGCPANAINTGTGEMLQELRADFERFAGVCRMPAGALDDGVLSEVFEGTRGWRDWARACGYRAAVDGSACERAIEHLVVGLRAA